MQITSSLALISFVLALLYSCGWFFTSRGKGRGTPSALSRHDFFHTDNAGLNTISLFVATVTVASGVGYLLAGGQMNGVLMFCVPVAMLLGFRLFGYFFGHVVSPDFSRFPSFWAAAQSAVTQARGGTSHVRFILVMPLVIIFLLFSAFELLVSAQIITALMINSAQVWAQVSVALGMFACALFLSWRGGVQAIFRTDRVQFFGIVLFAIVLLVTMFKLRWSSEASSLPSQSVLATKSEWLKLDGAVLLTIGLACISSIATQFYSAINHHIASNSTQRESQGIALVMRRASWMMFAFFIAMISVGVFSGIDWTKGLPTGVSAMLNQWPAGLLREVLLAISVVGLTCITLSTLDSLMIAVTLQLHDGVFGLDSHNKENNPAALAQIRRIMLISFGGVMLLALPAFFIKPNVFYTLLAIAAGAEVLVPLVILIGMLSRRPNSMRVLSNPRLWVYGVLFVVAIVLNLSLATHAPSWVPFGSLACLSLSSAYSMMLWLLSKK